MPPRPTKTTKSNAAGDAIPRPAVEAEEPFEFVARPPPGFKGTVLVKGQDGYEEQQENFNVEAAGRDIVRRKGLPTNRVIAPLPVLQRATQPTTATSSQPTATPSIPSSPTPLVSAGPTASSNQSTIPADNGAITPTATRESEPLNSTGTDGTLSAESGSQQSEVGLRTDCTNNSAGPSGRSATPPPVNAADFPLPPSPKEDAVEETNPAAEISPAAGPGADTSVSTATGSTEVVTTSPRATAGGGTEPKTTGDTKGFKPDDREIPRCDPLPAFEFDPAGAMETAPDLDPVPLHLEIKVPVPGYFEPQTIHNIIQVEKNRPAKFLLGNLDTQMADGLSFIVESAPVEPPPFLAKQPPMIFGLWDSKSWLAGGPWLWHFVLGGEKPKCEHPNRLSSRKTRKTIYEFERRRRYQIAARKAAKDAMACMVDMEVDPPFW